VRWIAKAFPDAPNITKIASSNITASRLGDGWHLFKLRDIEFAGTIRGVISIYIGNYIACELSSLRSKQIREFLNDFCGGSSQIVNQALTIVLSYSR
jgi:hypothetical protein